MSNKNKIYTTLGASNHTTGVREKDDFYATDPIALELLLKMETFNNVLEPACGVGHLSKVLKDKDIPVTSYDIVDRGFGEVKDFFSIDKWSGDIVTNPPYKKALDFIKHALEITDTGSKTAMFLKLQFLEGKSRKSFFQTTPPKFIYVSSSRIQCAKNGDFEGLKKSGGSAVAYAWFVWEKGFKGSPIIKWFN